MGMALTLLDICGQVEYPELNVGNDIQNGAINI